jgi:CheY-like chemotaxis protein
MTARLASLPPVVVVADGDAELRHTVTGFVSARGYRVESAADAEIAAGLLLDNEVDVLISDLAMRSAGGVDLLSFARDLAPTTRRIAIAANMTPLIRDAALRLGAIRALAKPLSLHELADAIDLARDCVDGFHGWMHRMSLIDVLQMYHHAGQSLVLRVSGDIEGAMWFQLGELIHAECEGRTGMAALTALLTAQRGQLETSAFAHATRTIAGPFDHVLLDGLRSLDEGRVEIGCPERPPAADDWLTEVTEHDQHDRRSQIAGLGTPMALPAGRGQSPRGIDRELLRRWVAEHAPGAGLWRIDPGAPTIERVDDCTADPETELADPSGSLGWAYELAEQTDPTWTRVELTHGTTGVALIRVPGVVLALVRLVTSEAIDRRFRVESAQLVRWLHDHAGRPT